MEEDSTILLDGKTMKYILKVDAQVHQELGSTYYCTDAFLDVCSSNLLHPSDTTSVAIIRRMTARVNGPVGMYPASTSPTILSLFETLMHHLVVKKAAYLCRS